MALNETSTSEFARAVKDYFFLLNREYPEKGALKLVGDRYRLSGTQRNCLYRGITSRANLARRHSKQTQNLKNQHIHVDGYNVIFTIMNYLLGKTLFIANDGFLRDSGESYGRIEKSDLFSRSIDLFLDYLSSTPPEHSLICLDTSIDNSRLHRDMLEDGMKARNLPGEILLSRHADTTLLKVKEGIIATSDSGIIDKSNVGVIDLARHCLEGKYKQRFTELQNLIQKQD